jgi:EmrB/QacA subfamily drug resistance transporter/channel protein (hemolysin III family)
MTPIERWSTLAILMALLCAAAIRIPLMVVGTRRGSRADQTRRTVEALLIGLCVTAGLALGSVEVPAWVIATALIGLVVALVVPTRGLVRGRRVVASAGRAAWAARHLLGAATLIAAGYLAPLVGYELAGILVGVAIARIVALLVPAPWTARLVRWGALMGALAAFDLWRHAVGTPHAWAPAIGFLAAPLLTVTALIRRRRTHALLQPGWKADARDHPRRWWALAALGTSLFLIAVDHTIFNVALPTLQRDLDATASQLAWIADAYVLAFAVLLLAAGNLGDRLGRVRLLCWGLVLLGAAALLASRSRSPEWLICARALMGVGAAMVMPGTLSNLSVVFADGPDRRKAVAIWSLISGASIATGPLAGGYLVGFGWRWVFYASAALAAVGLVAALAFVPEARASRRMRLDVAGLLLSAAGLVTLLWGVIEAPSHGWTSKETVAALALGLMLLGAFMWVELRVAEPMLPLRLFRDARFSAAAGAIALMLLALLGTLFLLGQDLQFVLGYGTVAAGAALLPVAAGMFPAVLFVGALGERLGRKAVVAGGLGLIAAAMWLLSTSADSAYPRIGACLLLGGVGMGAAMATATRLIMDALPPDREALAAAINETGRMVGAAVGVAVAATVLSTVYRWHMSDMPRLPGPLADAASDNVGAALQIAQRVGGPEGEALARLARSAFVDGMAAGLRLTATVTMLGALVALFWVPGRPAAGSTNAKPRWRGVIHQAASFVSVPVAAVLLSSARTTLALLAAVVYGPALIALFTASAMYHRAKFEAERLRRVDHAVIFVFIAATYTPFGLYRIGDWAAKAALALVWLGAAVLVVLKLRRMHVDRRLGTAMYVLLGGAAVAPIVALHRDVGTTTVAMIFLGGIFYLLGAITYARQRPDPWPKTFGFHEVFHLWVVLAAAVQALAIARWVIPFIK